MRGCPSSRPPPLLTPARRPGRRRRCRPPSTRRAARPARAPRRSVLLAGRAAWACARGGRAPTSRARRGLAGARPRARRARRAGRRGRACLWGERGAARGRVRMESAKGVPLRQEEGEGDARRPRSSSGPTRMPLAHPRPPPPPSPLRPAARLRWIHRLRASTSAWRMTASSSGSM